MRTQKARPVVQRYKQLVRCLRLLRIVRGRHAIDIAALAASFEVSKRTIRRDLAALWAAGECVPRLAEEKDMAA